MAYSNTLIKARTPRYRTIPLMQTPRRGEVRPTPVVLPVDDPRRDSWFPDPGNTETSWVSLGNEESEKPQAATRHGWPFVPVPAENIIRHRPGTLDYALNAENLVSQIVPSSAGRGALYPKRAGYDLMARIYSAKRWRIYGTLQGQSIDETWGPFSTFSIIVSNGVVFSRNENNIGGPDNGRDMAPLSLSISLSQSPELGNAGPDIAVDLDLTAPYAEAGSGGEGWVGRFSYLGAGLDGSGNSIIHPFISGDFRVDERRFITPTPSVSEPVAAFSGIFSSSRVFGFFGNPSESQLDVELSPITLCGYQLMTNALPGKFGDITGSLAIDVAETWGPGEWPV